jgi:hypothetical protein
MIINHEKLRGCDRKATVIPKRNGQSYVQEVGKGRREDSRQPCRKQHRHDEEQDRLEGRKRRRFSLSADRCENQGAGDWRGETLARVRILIKEADPEVVEDVKWRKPSNSMRGVPVWSHAGIICTGETYKSVVKLTFAKGASLEDPSGLFNSSLEGNTRRAIDFHEGDKIDEKALKALIRAAVALNTSSAARRSGTRAKQQS